MRRHTALVLLVLAASLAACSSGSSPTTTAPPSGLFAVPSATPSATPSGRPAARSAAPSHYGARPTATAKATAARSARPATAGPRPTAARTAVPPVAGSAIVIKNFMFTPSSLTVPVGTKVTATNQDAATHTWTSTSVPAQWSSGNLAPGKAYSYTFTRAGTFNYECTIHPYMKGSVTVR